MFWDKCAVCAADLNRVGLGNCTVYYCSEISHYELTFDRNNQLIFELFLFSYGERALKLRVDFLNKKSVILSLSSIIGIENEIKVPCYLGYYQMDKVKNYLIMA